ncbi:MAG TPA: metallophosphoesterase [Candidatus Binatia bacterium]|nr:metallophosphoesterase [Candidatus Binatia bacterium]
MTRPRLVGLLAGLALVLAVGPASATRVTLPLREDSVRFAVIGDTGTGAEPQYRVARLMAEYRAEFPFEFVLMLGDNIYGRETPDDMRRKFELPYAPLLGAGVKFFASLGNHDEVSQRFYGPFNMNGDRFYTFRSTRQSVRFFALDSNYMSADQLRWLDAELARSDEKWKICFFHHPLYTSGAKNGPSVALREELEPIFVRHRVSVVFSGHEHVYERVRPQKGIYYFVAGGGGKLSRGILRPEQRITVRGFDRGHHFMLVEIVGDELFFQAVSETGETVDAGTLPRPHVEPAE